MMGLSLRNVTLTLLKDGKTAVYITGRRLFHSLWHPPARVVLSASTYIDDVQLHRHIAEFDLKPALDEKNCDRLTRDFAALGGHSAQGALEELLPNPMRLVAVKSGALTPATRAAQITREQKMTLVHLCKTGRCPSANWAICSMR